MPKKLGWKPNNVDLNQSAGVSDWNDTESRDPGETGTTLFAMVIVARVENVLERYTCLTLHCT